MAVRKQLTVSWQNRAGELANVCRVLSDVGINIEALATAEAGEYGAVRLVVDDVDMAREVFHKSQVAHTTIDVFVIELPNRAGALADIAGRLSEENINIEYFYSAVAPGVERALGVFKVSDPWRADETTNMMEAND
tara:strand:+ start:301 stop:708 length:408 start_codon:yes stop_codon:yes gene_type:complete